MSCQVNLIANIIDIPAIRKCLFPTDDSRGNDNWLLSCEISVSPIGDLIVVAYEKRVVILTGQWDSSNSLQQFQISFSGCLHELDSICSVLCAPVVSQVQNSQVGPDWTCIIIGYESGYVRFYTENCTLLFEEQLHTENVVSIKCQSQHSPRPDISPELKPEEIYVQYQNHISIVNGPNLFSNLRMFRNQIVGVQVFRSTTESNSISTNPKKLGFTDQSVVNDSVVVGLDLANAFNHLLTASVCGGFDTKYRAMPPHNNLILGAGSKPYVGFHYALEGASQPVLSDVAKAVANKLKSALPGWLTGNRSQVDKQISVPLQQIENMGCRFGLCDLRRVATRVILSPNRKLAAVTDALGRVTLIDTLRGVTLRVFKGYRDAQCAFVQVPDERKTKHRAQRPIALFLIIYSPKKGTLEIFLSQGAKIATFTASKSSRLFYINYGLMGFTSTSKSRYVCQFTSLLIDPDGQLKEIVVPFHFALSEKNNKRARDLHLYKRLKQFIKSSESRNEHLALECLNTCSELKTTEVKIQCLNMIIMSKEIDPEIILRCSEYFLEKINTVEVEAFDNDLKQLKVLSENARCVANLYMYVIKNDSFMLDAENGNQNPADTKLSIGLKEMKNLQKLLDLSTMTDIKDIKVSFADKESYNISRFLQLFELSIEDKISLKKHLDDAELYRAAEMLFGKSIRQHFNDTEFEEQIQQSSIEVRDIFKILLTYWVTRPLKIHVNLEKEMSNLFNIIYLLSRSENLNDVIVEYNSTSSFWSEIRELLADAPSSFPALIAAILCRSVVQKLETDKDLDQSSSSLEDDIEIWEKLSQENCHWTLLIGKLEDISLLNIILKNKPQLSGSNLPLLNHDKVDISLKFILRRGRGSISELVAQWLTMGGVSAKNVINNEIFSRKCEDSSGDQQESSKTPNEKEIVELDSTFQNLNILRQQFPYSLNSSVLLANMCWEYCLAWQKNIEDVTLLETAIECLKCVPNCHIKCGLYNMAWNTHLKLVFESACKLINKVGKLPKERLCRQDTGLSDYQLTLFINVCADFFDTFMDVVHQCYNNEKGTLQFEPLWDNGSPSLAELALTQGDINFELLHLHYQLCECIQVMTAFTIKHTKPINSLFDLSVLPLFFTDLQQKSQVNWNKPDSKVNASRTQFLVKIITASMETVSMEDDKMYSADHVHWMSVALNLSRIWGLDVDLFKRYQIVRLFTSGYDQLAEELIPAVTDVSKLGPELLVVAGRRLLNYLNTSEDLAEKIAAFSTALTRYLDTLNGEWCASSSLERILNLTAQCIRCLQEEQNEYKMACLILEACSTLQDLQK